MNRQFQLIYQNIVSSIAFLPAIISLLFFLLSIGMVYFDIPFSEFSLAKSLDVLLVKGNDNARHVLSALIGGIISLTVFSFSMVMLLLNQASSSFTPRIIPGLLTDKKHQFVLGFYIGTIIYCIIIILNITPGEASHNSPKFGVLLAMLFGIVCLSLFIYFIHLISQKIQVDNIISLVTAKSIKLIEANNLRNSMELEDIDTTLWYPLASFKAGYFSSLHSHKLEKICKHQQIQVKMLYPLGSYLLEGTVFCRISLNIHKDKELKDKLLSCFEFTYEPYGESNYLHGINQLSEIAVKALSPGINDPGTALIALDHLSKVFCCLYQPEQKITSKHTKMHQLVIHQEYSLQELLFHFIHPIGNYGKKDAKVQARLLDFYGRLLPLVQPQEKQIIYSVVEEVVESIEENIPSPSQVAMLKNQISRLKTP
ncbi:DUF2254 domain-containing protein [Rhodocytophaga aerolata]|uniref:DUF2254 domain-containing protein n=1 Tax=Rhodocytophaga aerolata TaxID=455078 RepID=A0ABT8RH08_9BACT|nr:DUF2254 domain-containing protein [Rhodocytophaga aerolata]MDO1450639.1 DUF2254 domain-containing protein [Rhodocytophaga aerolata]